MSLPPTPPPVSSAKLSRSSFPVTTGGAAVSVLKQVVFVCVCEQAIERGQVFEVSYSAAIRDSTMRRYTITNAVALMETCKGKVCTFCPSRLPLALAGCHITFLHVGGFHIDVRGGGAACLPRVCLSCSFNPLTVSR